jgi:hypothetical protein
MHVLLIMVLPRPVLADIVWKRFNSDALPAILTY